MQRNILKEFLLYLGILILAGTLLISSVSSLSSGQNQVLSYGKTSARARVLVDFSQVTGVNNLSLGVQVEGEWSAIMRFPELQNKFIDVKFKMIRFFVYLTQPCVSWNETTMTGVYNWSTFDKEMQTLQNLGVENTLICIGHNSPLGIPQGMERNYNSTGFPNPESFAVYSKDVALHVKNGGWSVKYWEPYNEPYQVFDNKTAYMGFVNLYNAATDAVLQTFPNALFGVDISNRKVFLDNFVYDGRNVGFLSFHKYDATGSWVYKSEGYLSDSKILRKASILGDNSRYTPQEMQEKWRSVRDVELPVFCTETNLNSVHVNGTDPRLQQVIGATWYAEELRAFILGDVTYSVYFHFASDASESTPTGGYGFGMVNKTSPFEEWYPYLVNHLIGDNLNVGDSICNASSSNSAVVSALAWRTSSSYNVLLTGKMNDTVQVNIRVRNASLKSESVSTFTIDNRSPNLQISDENFTDALSILENGYFVILLRFS